MKAEKWIMRGLILLQAGILLLTGGLIGMRSEKERINQEEQRETVIDIAIVNMDEGIYENNQKRFYSSELMDLEADNLIAENLEAARQGISNGSYAAYILIPAEFSQNAVSINGMPRKATLEFALNPNLREDISRLTMANVKNFEISLNTNMSYMYVQAILTEFHNVQDSAGTILENDTAELTRLLAIDPQSLMTELEFVEIERVDVDIEAADFDETFDTNIQISEDLQENYDSFVEEGEKAFEQIKEREITVAEGMDSFYGVVGELDIETDIDGKVVYEAGLTALSDSVEEYEKDLQEQKAEIAAMLGLPAPSAAPTAMPEETAAPTPTPNETPAPGETATPSLTPNETPAPGETATPSLMPNETPAPEETATPSPTPVLIPPLIEEMMEASLEDINEEIEEINEKNRLKITKIKENLTYLKNLADIDSIAERFSEKSEEEAAKPENPEEPEIEENLQQENPEEEYSKEQENSGEKESQTENTEKPGEEGSAQPEEPDSAGKEEQWPEAPKEENTQQNTQPEGNDKEEQQPENPEGSHKGEAIAQENFENGKEKNIISINAAKGKVQQFYLLSAQVKGSSTDKSLDEKITTPASTKASAEDYLQEINAALDNLQIIEPITAEDIYQEDKIKESLNKLIVKIENLPQIDTMAINEILEQKILLPLEEEIQNENTKVQDEGGKYMEIMEAYMEEMASFDAYGFFDYEKMDELLYSFEDNIFNLEEQVIESNGGYADFAFDVYEKTDENVTHLQTNLEEAYQGTTQNVQNEIDLAKKYRQEINTQNTALLNEFTQKLLYTRVGKLEYVQAYDFIVKPVQMWDTSVTKNRVSVLHDYDGLKSILIAMITLWCLLMCSLLILKLHAAAGRNPDRE